MLEDLRDEERMQWRLIVPNLGIKSVAAERQRGFGEFKAFVGTNPASGSNGQQALQNNQRPNN